MAPLTIRKPETLANRIALIEGDTFATATKNGGSAETAVRINGVSLTFTVTPSVKPGRVYRLWRQGGKRIRRDNLTGILLPAA